jgi:hypothetical protein
MRDPTDTTIKMTPGGYTALTGPQLVGLLRRFRDAGLDKRQARRGETAAMADELDAYPAQAWRTLGLWREGYYADIDLDEQPAEQPAAAAPREGESGIKFTADERHQISDLLGEIAAVATMLQRRLQQ